MDRPNMLFLISILHQTATIYRSLFKPSLLFLISILHQTATVGVGTNVLSGCSLSVFYIKPQHPATSFVDATVVPYQYSTSNRNASSGIEKYQQLFLISILHQTATFDADGRIVSVLFLISILHQTATFLAPKPPVISCSLSVFYIKPQPADD